MSELLITTGVVLIIIAIMLTPIKRKRKINKQAKFNLEVKKRMEQLEKQNKK